MSDTLLITACIKPNTKIAVVMANENQRLQSYLKGINFWIEHSHFTNLVFVENSQYDYDYSTLIKKAKEQNKALEILVFKGSEKSMSYGKGYAEGEIFKYAIENSQLLKKTKSFYKASGRIIVENINKILSHHANNTNAFNLEAPNAKSVDTRFFKVGLNFFKENLLNIYNEVRDKEGVYLEHIFYKYLKDSAINSFSRYPIIAGDSGSTGHSYKKTKFAVFIRDILTKLNLYKIK